MLLTIDAGNTQIKAAVFEKDILLYKEIIPYTAWQNSLENILKKFSKITNIAVISVGKLELSDFLTLHSAPKVAFLDKNTKMPFINGYSTPKTLGIDRMILASGAVLLYPNTNRLVIDMGTCITYDFINDKNEYLGGAIAPGIRLRYEALHNYTAKLPLLEKSIPENRIGNSTQQSIHSGVINGVCYEIDGFIEAYSQEYKNFIIILTGGDAEFLAKRLKNTIFANPNFLLESLNKTFQYNQND
ncbi:type III pantothenate kinase [Flavobacterium sp. SUN046]|uniref:type III pantothenate kinase n=1 Tax=Flavobacterium sp. SUN046 TaxID=3002440 RepID=UPI002DBB4EAC|nr:type III pantothenate kinase [Flavobacterium sp. SUN046]MEC4049184.1 type III pantothenate kinase [Flavobacterium sp. SUN046]